MKFLSFKISLQFISNIFHIVYPYIVGFFSFPVRERRENKKNLQEINENENNLNGM